MLSALNHNANMTQQARIEALKARHAALSSKIEKEQNRPSVSDWYLRDLKRQKLRLKDEIIGMNDNQRQPALDSATA